MDPEYEKNIEGITKFINDYQKVNEKKINLVADDFIVQHNSKVKIVYNINMEREYCDFLISFMNYFEIDNYFLYFFF